MKIISTKKVPKLCRKTGVWLGVMAALTVLNAVLSCVGIPVPNTRFYLNDIVIVTAATVLDPLAAVVVAGVGSFVGDLIFSPISMFATLIIRCVQAFVISCFSQKVLKKRPVAGSAIGVVLGTITVIIGYTLARAFNYSTPVHAMKTLPYISAQAVLGAVVGMILSLKCGLRKWYNDTAFEWRMPK